MQLTVLDCVVVDVTRLVIHEPCCYADNADDYYGYTELEIEIENVDESMKELAITEAELYDVVEQHLLHLIKNGDLCLI